MSAIYIDRDVVRLPAPASKIRITREGATKSLVRSDESRFASAAFDEADVLSFDKVLHLGAPAKDDGFDPPRASVEIEAESDAGARVVKRIQFGAKIGNMYTARIDGIAAIYGVSMNRVRALVNDPPESKSVDGGAP